MYSEMDKSQGSVRPFTRKQKTAKTVKAASKNKALNDHGLVSIVSAGPGDPELLTMKAFRVIQQTDVIIYDDLVSEKIRTLFPDNCDVLYVGKREDSYKSTQQQIHRFITNKAKQGLNVCHVKGGDTYFNHVNEEVSALKALSLKVQFIPGIMSGACYPSFDFAVAL